MSTPPDKKKAQLRLKCDVYARYPHYSLFEAAYNAQHDDTLLQRINSDIRNEIATQLKDGYAVTRQDAYHWKRNMLLVEAGPQFLHHVSAPIYECLPYNKICPAIAPPPKEAYAWKRNLLLAEGGAEYLINSTAPIYTCEPYRSLAPSRTSVAAAVTSEPETMTFEQIKDSNRFPATRLWLSKKLLADNRLDQVMCARCKADDKHCNKQGSHRGCWTQPVCIKLLTRVEHSLTRHTPKRERKRRRGEADNNGPNPATRVPAFAS